MDTAIRTGGITRYYGNVHAVESVSLNVNKGEIYGFLGLNGAGKTTVIRMLLGMIRPTSGSAFLFGSRVKPGNNVMWSKVGYMVEIPYSYPDLTVRENLEIVRRLRLLPEKGAVDRVMDGLKLGQYSDRKAKNLSLGNAQRLGLAKALIHDPEILILDEPANGLDPAGIFEIREMLQNLAVNHGVTIFISSHILGEISKFATRIGIIHEGHLLLELDSDQMERLCSRRLQLDTTNNEAARSLLEKEGYPTGFSASGILEISHEKAISHPENIASLLVHAGIAPRLLKVEEEELEQYFLRLVGMDGGPQNE